VAPGEILIGEAAYAAANLNREDWERRQLELKEKSELNGVRVWPMDRTYRVPQAR
jgi:hypothetical protein